MNLCGVVRPLLVGLIEAAKEDLELFILVACQGFHETVGNRGRNADYTNGAEIRPLPGELNLKEVSSAVGRMRSLDSLRNANATLSVG